MCVPPRFGSLSVQVRLPSLDIRALRLYRFARFPPEGYSMRALPLAALLLVAFPLMAQAELLRLDVTYTNGQIIDGPLSADLSKLPEFVNTSFLLNGSGAGLLMGTCFGRRWCLATMRGTRPCWMSSLRRPVPTAAAWLSPRSLISTPPKTRRRSVAGS